MFIANAILMLIVVAIVALIVGILRNLYFLVAFVVKLVLWILDFLCCNHCQPTQENGAVSSTDGGKEEEIINRHIVVV